MRAFPKLRQQAVSRKATTAFGGYNHNPVIGDNEFYDMKNMTSDLFPVASVRKARSAYEDIGGSTMQDAIALHHRYDWPVVCDGHGNIYCGGHYLGGLLDMDEVWEAECSVPGVKVLVDKETFRLAVSKDEMFTPVYVDKRSRWEFGGNGVQLEDYGIRVQDTPTGWPQDGDVLCVRYYDGVMHDNRKKQIVSMGAWCIIWPDKVYFNAVKLANGDELLEGEDFGHLEKTYDTDEYIVGGVPISIDIQPCKPDGTPFSNLVNSDTAPESPEDGDYWRDISNFPYEIKQWNAELNKWNGIESLVRIRCEGISERFEIGDSVRIACYETSGGVSSVSEKVGGQELFCEVKNILTGMKDSIVVNNLYVNKEHHTVTDLTRVTVQTVVPKMDYIVECGNRLWGCYYGVVDGEHINEIYACKLGDFKSWNTFAGISTDSYVASRGADGKYTGAAVYGGNPLFFRENSFEKIFPSAGGAHQITTVNYPGIQDGSWMSPVIVDGTLFYKGRDGVYAYTGSVPRLISDALGGTMYYDAVAAPLNRKYYISMRDGVGEWTVFVFDTAKGLWHKEDNTEFYFACEYKGDLYFITPGESFGWKYGEVGVSTNVPWMIETGIIGLNTPDQKRIARIVLRLKLEIGATAKISVQYDSDGRWHDKMQLRGNGLRTMVAPIVPIRCDHMKIRMSGIGGMELYSMAYNLEQGSDVP